MRNERDYLTKFFAIIPARAGSKRIPDKNVQLIDGKPLISFPIVSAINSGVFEEVYVSTDSQKIANIAEYYGASAPFIRDAKLSDDLTPTIPVIRDAISRLPQIAIDDVVVCIYPTSIFVSPELLVRASLLSHQLSNSNFVVSFTNFPYPIQRALRKNLDNKLNFFSVENALARSQDLEPAFHDAAQFYLARVTAWNVQDSVFKDALGIEIPRKYVQDIDTPEDLENAKLIYKLIAQT